MTRRIVTALLVLALGAAVLFGIQWAYETWRSSVLDEGDARGAGRVEKLWADDVIERDRVAAAALAGALVEQKRMAELSAGGERDALEKRDRQAAMDRADRDHAAAVAGSLSGDITALNTAAAAIGIPGAAACPAEFVRQRDEAVRARNLLGACSAAYVDLARSVDDAFTALELRLDTALSYIRAVQHAPP